VSISAGDDHLLALTSAGRTFAHPITANANSSGQLGFRKFEIVDGHPRLIELKPKAAQDPFAKASAFLRRKAVSVDEAPAKNLWKDDNQGFCNRLYEIPALKGIQVSQIATAARSSYVRTSDGKILGWGANEYG
jgi:alpha-tubulin suppressor-like RCC1 family protein